MRYQFQVSLPLMGIGNVCDKWFNRWLFVALITPHGDRKPAASFRRASSFAAHYPSWDRKLSHLISSRSNVHSSLPLMGIGNSIKATADLYNDYLSLPLMGIGNHWRRGPAGCRRRLITPHGDRKLP